MAKIDATKASLSLIHKPFTLKKKSEDKNECGYLSSSYYNQSSKNTSFSAYEDSNEVLPKEQ